MARANASDGSAAWPEVGKVVPSTRARAHEGGGVSQVRQVWPESSQSSRSNARARGASLSARLGEGPLSDAGAKTVARLAVPSLPRWPVRSVSSWSNGKSESPWPRSTGQEKAKLPRVGKWFVRRVA
jgi:hypothetical protein